MATAPPISLSAPSGVTLYAGRFAAGLFGNVDLGDVIATGALGTSSSGLSGSTLLDDVLATGSMIGLYVPAWRQAMSVNTWATPSASTLSDVDPKFSSWNPNGSGATAPWSGSTGQATVPDAWGSMMVSPEGKAYLGGGGAGGHSNYAGNEFYDYDATQDSPAFRMIRPPSGAVGNVITLNDGQELTGLYSDGRLRAVHSYNNQIYVPGVGPVLYRHGTTTYANGSQGTDKVWCISTSTGEKSGPCADITNAGVGNSGFGNPGNSTGAGCAYDPTRNRIYGMGNGSNTLLTYVDVGAAGATWNAGYKGAAQQGMGTYGALVYLPTLDRLLLWTGSSYAVLIHPDTGASTTVSFTGSAPSGFVDEGAAGIEWCPALGKFLLWNNTSNTTAIVTLTPGATVSSPFTWGSLSLSGSNTVTPPTKSGNGTFGKFRYCPKLKGCFLLPASNTAPMYFYATE